MKCRTCKEPNADNGEGWDGECGDCADKSAKRTLATPEQIRVATNVHANGECEIDDGALVSEADDGYWVQAWVWVSTPPES